MATLNPAQILTLALRAGFSPDREQAVIATAIALAESGGNPRAHNPKPPDDSFGLWQINMIGDLGPQRREALGLKRDEELFDPPINARAARHIFLERERSFEPWSTFTNGLFMDHMGAARRAAAELEADLTTEELLEALESPRGQKALAAAVTGVLRIATGPDDGSQPASVFFDHLRKDVKAIKDKVV